MAIKSEEGTLETSSAPSVVHQIGQTFRARCRRAVSAILASLMFSNSTEAAQEAPAFKNGFDLDSFTQFTQTYYQHPRPELVADLIEALYPTGISRLPHAALPNVAFFSEIFAANPTRLQEWQAAIEKQDVTVRDILAQAVTLSKEGGTVTVSVQSNSALAVRTVTVSRAGGVLTVADRSGNANDVYWGAFFASGRPVYIQDLVDVLRYYDERQNGVLFMAGATAKWSLASNAGSDPTVRTILQGLEVGAEARTRAIIADLLAQDPARIQQDMRDIVRKQREAGKWN